MRILILTLSAVAFAQSDVKRTIIPKQDDSATGILAFREKYANGSHEVQFRSNASLAATITNTWPSAHPTTSGQCLTGTTAGVWSWATCGAADYDVRSYGAVCDGATDDTAAIAATIAAIGSNRGVVVLPPGVCLVTGVTFTSSYQGMRGQGRDVSQLYSTTNATIIDIPTVATSGEFIAMDFSDFTIKGNGGTSQIGIRAIGTGLIDYTTIHRLTFDNVYKGIVVAPSIQSSFVHIQDNLFVGPFNCVDRNTPGTGWIITGNTATMAAGGTCIYIHGSSGVGDIIVNSNHIESGAVGIDFYCDTTCTYGSRIVCNDNKIDSVTTAPIQAFNVTGSTFLGNRVIGGFDPVTFTGDNFDNIYDAGVSGIKFSDASSGHLTLHGGDFLIDGRGAGTQIHMSNTSTGGAYLFSAQDHQAWFMAGIEWDGTNFIPRATQASILRLSQGRMAFFGETGLTTGSPYVPGLRWEIDSSYNWVPGADDAYSVGTDALRPSVLYGHLGDFSVDDPSTYNAVVAENAYTGAYGACYAMSATDSVGSTVYVAGRICGRYTSNTFSSEEVTIQTATGVGGYETAITIVNDDVTIDDVLVVGGNATLSGSINTMSGTLRPGFTGLGSIGDSSYSYGSGYFDQVVTPTIGTNTAANVVIERNNTAMITLVSGEIQFNGDVNFGNEINSDMLPQTASAYNIGASMNRWLTGYFVDLNVSGTCTGCGSSSLPVVDTTAIVKGSADATKIVRFEVDGLTTATTRALTVQDANYTIAGTNIAQTFSGANTFTAGQTFAGNIAFGTGSTYNIGAIATRGNSIYFDYGYFLQVDIPSGGSLDILSGGNLQSNGSNGLSVTKTVRDAAGTGTCTLIFGNGILTGGTC
jgi:hypothetical protein